MVSSCFWRTNVAAVSTLAFATFGSWAKPTTMAASFAGYKEAGRFKQPERSKIQAWPHPVIANGGLYLRDQGVLLCFDVSARSK